MADYINQNGLAYSVATESEFGKTPTTGARHDLPLAAGQAPLTSTIAQIEDDTQRPNLETAAPTNGHESASGTLSMRLRMCEAVKVLIQSAIAGKFDNNGLAFGGEEDVFFTLFTQLTTKAGASNNGYLGYVDAGNACSSWSIQGSAREGVQTSFEIVGTKRTKSTAAPSNTLTAPAGIGFNYKNVKNVSVANQELEFISLDFQTGVARDHRIVFGKQQATSLAKTENRATTLNLKGFRKDFAVDTLIDGTPVPVTFEISDDDGNGLRITLPAAVCTSPTDELDAMGLLITLDFSGRFDDVSQAGLIVELIEAPAPAPAP